MGQAINFRGLFVRGKFKERCKSESTPEFFDAVPMRFWALLNPSHCCMHLLDRIDQLAPREMYY